MSLGCNLWLPSITGPASFAPPRNIRVIWQALLSRYRRHNYNNSATPQLQRQNALISPGKRSFTRASKPSKDIPSYYQSTPASIARIPRQWRRRRCRLLAPPDPHRRQAASMRWATTRRANIIPLPIQVPVGESNSCIRKARQVSLRIRRIHAHTGSSIY